MYVYFQGYVLALGFYGRPLQMEYATTLKSPAIAQQSAGCLALLLRVRDSPNIIVKIWLRARHPVLLYQWDGKRERDGPPTPFQLVSNLVGELCQKSNYVVVPVKSRPVMLKRRWHKGNYVKIVVLVVQVSILVRPVILPTSMTR